MKTLVLISLIALFDFDNDGNLLTGTSMKSWYISKETPADNNSSYKTISADNSFIFYADGKFEFDHGTITEDPSCINECPSDLVNLTGTWKFTRGGKGIKVTTTHETGNPTSKMETVLIDATLIELTEDSFSFSQQDEETKQTIVFEFRKR